MHVLVLEDDKIDQIAFKNLVKNNKLTYTYSIVSSISEAEDSLNKNKYDVVIADYSLGDGTAFDIFNDLQNTPIIIITGAGDEDIAVKAMKEGAYDYLIKDIGHNYLKYLPMAIDKAIEQKKKDEELTILSHAVKHISDSVYIFNMDEQIIYVNEAFCITYGYTKEEVLNQSINVICDKESEKENDQIIAARKQTRGEYSHRQKDGTDFMVSLSMSVIKDEHGEEIAIVGIARDITERKRVENELKTLHILRKSMEDTVHAMARTLELHDPYTADHQRRVAKLSYEIAKKMGLKEEQVEGVRLAGLLHDIGKINIPAEFLSKPGKLTGAEWEVMKTHSQVGFDILSTIEFPYPIAKIVIQHHERINGSGYPTGLSGNEILLEAKILCVADVVESMASHRPYRPARGIDLALEEISQNKGVLYDSTIVDACTELFSQDGFEFDSD